MNKVEERRFDAGPKNQIGEITRLLELKYLRHCRRPFLGAAKACNGGQMHLPICHLSIQDEHGASRPCGSTSMIGGVNVGSKVGYLDTHKKAQRTISAVL